LSRRKAIGTLSIIGVVAVVVILFIIGGIAAKDFTTAVAVSLTLLILPLAIFMFRPEIEKLIESRKESLSQQQPVLTYGRIIVRRTTELEHGGIYHKRSYHLEVINTSHNTVARNCTGSIDIPETKIRNYAATWERNRSETIHIGHRELLNLFRVSVFRREYAPEAPETRLYFDTGRLDYVDKASEERFTNSLDRSLTVLIQSHNADFPPETESFSRTVRQIIDEAVEE
jgi:hypothetical protein